jgi:hypothetical protein
MKTHYIDRDASMALSFGASSRSERDAWRGINGGNVMLLIVVLWLYALLIFSSTATPSSSSAMTILLYFRAAIPTPVEPIRVVRKACRTRCVQQ